MNDGSDNKVLMFKNSYKEYGINWVLYSMIGVYIIVPLIVLLCIMQWAS